MGWCWLDGEKCLLHNQNQFGLLNSRVDYCKKCNTFNMYCQSQSTAHMIEELGFLLSGEDMPALKEIIFNHYHLLLQLVEDKIRETEFEKEYLREEENEEAEALLSDLRELQEVFEEVSKKDLGL